MRKVGEPAPDFTAESSSGRTINLRELRGRPVVIYFFPKAFTLGCTIETRRFRDNYEEIARLGAEVIGVSADKLDKQCRFAEDERLPFSLVGDEERRICAAYGVLWPILNLPQRVTFVVDEEGIIQAVFHHEVQVFKHVEEVLRFLQTRRAGRAPA